MFDAEQLVIETISQHTGIDPSDFSTKTKLRDRSYIRATELDAIIADLEGALSVALTDALPDLQTIGDLIDVVSEPGGQ